MGYLCNMVKPFVVFVFLLISVSAQSQTPGCVDSLRIPDTYYPCSTDFNPVCGCDNVTYRNECAAFFWGGITSWSLSPYSCTSFFLDFYPTAIDYFPAQLSIYMKEPGSVAFYIYDVFGKLYYQGPENPNATYPSQILTDQINVQNFPRGIYIGIAIVGGEVQYVKFAKVTDNN